ncbi:MAG: hypothetical protein ACI9LE_000311 [Paraglaciecola sp.]|jgi:hypothetical protein
MNCIRFKYPVGNLLVDGYQIKSNGQKNLSILIYNHGVNDRYSTMILAQCRGAFDKSVVIGKYDKFSGA